MIVAILERIIGFIFRKWFLNWMSSKFIEIILSLAYLKTMRTAYCLLTVVKV